MKLAFLPIYKKITKNYLFIHEIKCMDSRRAEMKRLIIVLGVLILLLDAADDGFIGNHKSVAPDHLLTAIATNHQGHREPIKMVLGQRNLTVAPLVTYLLQMTRHCHYQSAEVPYPYPGKITLCSHLCSSGGLPS